MTVALSVLLRVFAAARAIAARGVGRRLCSGGICLALLVGLIAPASFGARAATPASPKLPAPPDSAFLRASPSPPDSTRLRLLLHLANGFGPSNSPLSVHYGELALPLALRLRDGDKELWLIDLLAFGYGRIGNTPLALRLLLRELRRARRLGSRRYEIDALLAIANTQLNDANQAAAGTTLRQALALVRQPTADLTFQPTKYLARVSSQFGNYHLSLGQYDSCIYHMRIALPIFTRLGRLYEQGDCLSSLAEAALGQRRYADALGYGRRAATLMARKGDSYGQGWVAGVLCKAALGNGQPELARQYGEEAVEFARRAGIPGAEDELLGTLIDAYERQQAWPDAFRWLRRRTALHDSLYNRTRAAEMAELQTRFDTEAKRQQIRALQTRARIQALEADRDRARLLGLAAGAALLLAALGVGGVLYARLRRAGRRLAVATQAKDRLYAIIAHDLRGPLVAFQGLADVLGYYHQRGEVHELGALSTEVREASQHLSGLLDNLLHWAADQSGELTCRPEPLPVAALLAEVTTLYAAAARARQVRLTWTAPPDLLVHADRNMTLIILRNLTHNALKVAPPNSEVALAAAALPTDATSIALTVIDGGPGLTPAQVSALLMPVAATPTDDRPALPGEQGTGLGLPLVQRLARRQGGGFSLSATPGAGAVARVTLPRG